MFDCTELALADTEMHRYHLNPHRLVSRRPGVCGPRAGVTLQWQMGWKTVEATKSHMCNDVFTALEDSS